MRHTFLHLSDLHYRPGWPESTDLVWKAFCDDLATQISHYDDPHLVFSGDLAFAGGTENLYSAFATNIAEGLNGHFSRDRIICVPGNHDISQEALRPLVTIQMGALAELTSEALFNDHVPQLSEMFFQAKLRNYVAAEAAFAKYGCCQTTLGGTGWDLPNGIGVYCLNTALCSYAHLTDSKGVAISDKSKLMIDTRVMQQWLLQTNSTIRILVMHHPIEWLTPWANSELDKIIARDFRLVFSGHVHQATATFSSRGDNGVVEVSAPPLFTCKSDLLGYSFVTLDTETDGVEVQYRQWTPGHKFVTGTALSNTDTGTVSFPRWTRPPMSFEGTKPLPTPGDTHAILQVEFEEATTSYSSKQTSWVDRDLASMPETAPDRDKAILLTPQDLIDNLRPVVVRAPRQFGLTCLGRHIAFQHWRQNENGNVVAMLDVVTIPPHRQGILGSLEARCQELGVQTTSLAAIILDNYSGNKPSRRILKELRLALPQVPTIILQSIDDCARIADAIEIDNVAEFETLYLWALTKTRLRELVTAYVQEMDDLDDDLVTARVNADIEALNIHRSPLNCLMILRLAEQAFEESPVNRTEMIGRVLTLLFLQFDQIPRYATRPDLKDCEYALGYFCEWLVRAERTTFSKSEFYDKAFEYCKAQLLDLDVEVLFAFLATENILVRKGTYFGFRFSYWLYYFAAHRMHHDKVFSTFILSDGRYAAYPELIEFYAGIDRRRSDAVACLTTDLARMNSDFLTRTQIASDLNPFGHATWSPDQAALKQLQDEVTNSMAESALPAAVKDAVADKQYDRARPYYQDLGKFIETSSLLQLMQAIRGAARVLRNSDHVTPEAKTALLDEVLSSWIRICQILVILSPVLAVQRKATFEDISFVMSDWDEKEEPRHRWALIMNSILDNVVSWFQDDIFSKKMGALLCNHIKTHRAELSEVLVLLVMIRQKAPGWERETKRFIFRQHKNSFYLSRVFAALRTESRIGFFGERTRQELRHLAAMTIAKHQLGVKRPNQKLIREAAEALDKQGAASR
ncbi:MAG: metallophosphoesterase [Bryobacterales bacterium]|nr:metallophosphoesterase [Bryobacterales bacterium]